MMKLQISGDRFETEDLQVWCGAMLVWYFERVLSAYALPNDEL